MSAASLLARMAWRNVLRNPRRSLLTVVAITFGLLCLLVFQGLKVGLHDAMVASTVELDSGALQVQAAGYQTNLAGLHPLPEGSTAQEALHKAGVTSFSPRLQVPAMVLAGNDTATLVLTGIDPAREQEVTALARRVEQGGYLAGGEGILIGAPLAKALKVEIGDRVTLMAQGLFGRPVTRPFPVTGIFATELATFDRSHAYLALPAAQNFLQAEGLISAIAVAAPRGSEQALARRLQSELSGDSYQVRTWRELTPDLVQLIELNDATMKLLVIILFFIVGLGIINTMTTIIFERYREWGILLALGTRPRRILALVVLEAFFLGIIAATIGSLAGLGVCAWLADHGLDLSALTSSNQYLAATHVIKARLLVADFWSANLVTLAVALLAGVFPAWRASRLQPVEALRHT